MEMAVDVIADAGVITVIVGPQRRRKRTTMRTSLHPKRKLRQRFWRNQRVLVAGMPHLAPARMIIHAA